MDLADDDILDAMAAAITITASAEPATLPEDRARDGCGLPMEMVHVKKNIQ